MSACHFFLSDTARAETDRPNRAWRVRTYFFLRASCIRPLFFPTQRDNPHRQNPQQAISSRRFANEPCLDSKFEQNNTTRSKEKRTAATCRRSNVCKHRIRRNKKIHQANRLAQPAGETREPKFYDQLGTAFLADITCYFPVSILPLQGAPTVLSLNV